MWSTESLQAFEFATKNGKPIEFKFIFDDEKDKMASLWIVHKLEAYVDNELVGFMKVSYIPEATWNEKIENTPFDPVIVYSDIVRGSSLGFRHATTYPEEHTVLSKLSLSVCYSFHNDFTEEKVGTDDYNEKKNIVLNRARKKHLESYTETKGFHVEQPLVDYIDTEEDWKRQGIGHAMYYMMASIVSENGYRMRSSGIKTEEGSAHFRSFSLKHPELIVKENGYYFIDFNLEENLLMSL